MALDLGCGNGLQRGVLQELGYVYYGVDFASTIADDLVDAHALPYCDNLFDVVLSIAVLEHLAQPFKALDEVYRVLKPSRLFIGTVAFLEPFHDNSFFHFSHLGLWAALQLTGFAVETILSIPGWHVARAQVEMGFGSRLPRWLTILLSQPFAWALVRLDGADTAMLHAVDAGNPSRMRTGMRVRVRWRAETVGEIQDIECFEPEDPA